MKRSMWLTTTTARQLRSADTLSGGETFLASLALALQLGEQVQKAAEATKLDSLFIDEGFGTLDPEALDAAASVIESLRVGGADGRYYLAHRGPEPPAAGAGASRKNV
jgi:DNA repair exonuclease SbcCD ATPase subunit